MSANEHDDDQPDSFEVIERLRAELAGAREVLTEYDKVNDALRTRVAKLEGVIQTQNGVVVSGTLKLNEARARVAKLEAALADAGVAMADWHDGGYKLPHLIQRIDAVNAVLEDVP